MIAFSLLFHMFLASLPGRDEEWSMKKIVDAMSEADDAHGRESHDPCILDSSVESFSQAC